MMPLFLQNRSIRVLFWMLVIGLGLAVYLRNVSAEWPSNPLLSGRSRKGYDQPYYMEGARGFATGDSSQDRARSRMPLYPWLLSFLHQNAETDALVERYMTLNVVISVASLLCIAWIVRRHLGDWWACWLTLLTALHVFVFKAILIQPEVLYYTCSFAVFVAMLHALVKPGWGWPRLLALGLFTGVTYLLKGSALPMLGLFVMLMTARGLWTWYLNRKTIAPGKGVWQNLAPPCVFLVGFLIVAGCYMTNSYRWYGSSFYDPNSRYYLWADSQEEMGTMQMTGLAFTKPTLRAGHLDDPDIQQFLPKWIPDDAKRRAFEDKLRAVGVLELTGEYDILPGARNYFQTHSLHEAFDRLSDGLMEVFEHNADHPDGYGGYVIVLCLLAAAYGAHAAFHATAGERHQWLKRHGWAAAFVVLTVGVNIALYGWWAAVSNRNRFFLTQFLPIMFCAALILQRTAERLPWSWELPFPKDKPLRVTVPGLVMLVLMLLLLWNNRRPFAPHLLQ